MKFRNPITLCRIALRKRTKQQRVLIRKCKMLQREVDVLHAVLDGLEGRMDEVPCWFQDVSERIDQLDERISDTEKSVEVISTHKDKIELLDVTTTNLLNEFVELSDNYDEYTIERKIEEAVEEGLEQTFSGTTTIQDAIYQVFREIGNQRGAY